MGVGIVEVVFIPQKLPEFKTEEIPWITEATEDLIEDIVWSKYRREAEKMPYLEEEIEELARRVEEAAKRFIRFCREIGGNPKVREYSSRFFGTIDLVCYLGDGSEIYTVSYFGGHLSVGTNKGGGSLDLPEGLNKVDIRLKEPKSVKQVVFDEHMKPVEFAVKDLSGIREISMDIYSDHVKLDFRSETIEEIIHSESV